MNARKIIRLQELLESWVNGNRSYVRAETKKLRRVEFARFVLLLSNDQGAHEAESFLNGF